MNIAALMEKEGGTGRVNISQTTFQQVDEAFETEARGQVDSGKKGLLAMYFVNRLKPEFSSDPDGIKPNEEFQKRFGNLLRVYDR